MRVNKKPILFLILFIFLAGCNANHPPKINGIFNLSNTSQTPISFSYSISGSISGLTGNLSLSLNATETLTLSSNGNFSFMTSLSSGVAFNITFSSYSTGQYCSIQNATGTITSNVTNVTVICQAGNSNGPLVGGTVFNPLSMNYNITTIASGAMFSGINGVTTDGTNIYFTSENNHTILKLDPSTNAVTVIAGQSAISGFTNGASLAATFNFPEALVYTNNSLFITDKNNSAIRKVDLSSNLVSTFATGITDPYGITTDGSFLYVAETGKVTKIQITSATISVIAGSGVTGFTDGVGASAQFAPQGSINGGITFDGVDLYLNDRGNCAIRKIVISTGAVTTIAGSPPPMVICGVLLDGIGTSSRINRADGIISDGTNLYFAETGGCVIRQIQMSNLNVSTVAGLSGSCGLLDGTGSVARINSPALLASDGVNVYIADWGNNAIRKMN